MELLQRLHEQEVDGKPDRTSPVGIPTEESSARLTRLVPDDVVHAMCPIVVGMFRVVLADRSDTVVAQKLIRIEHALEQALHTMPTYQRQQAAFLHPWLVPA